MGETKITMMGVKKKKVDKMARVGIVKEAGEMENHNRNPQQNQLNNLPKGRELLIKIINIEESLKLSLDLSLMICLKQLKIL